MDIFNQLIDSLVSLIPTAITITLVVFALIGVRLFLNRQLAGSPNKKFRVQLTQLLLSFIGLLIIILTLPISEGKTGQLLSLIGILLSAAIALSATTFVGNIMAGLMQRAVKAFRPGDFISVGEHFGRVSEQGLFHVEIQTEMRDLTTMPNLYLATNPVKVIRASGTLITAEVSLGYDVPRKKVEKCLRKAAEAADLTEPFVHIVELGDFSVTYRVVGLLTNIKSLITARSRLKEMMLDHLHDTKIEIVSPTFMNQRQIREGNLFIPQVSKTEEAAPANGVSVEAVVFDKADEAETIENLKKRQQLIKDEILEIRDEIEKASDENDKKRLTEKLKHTVTRADRLAAYIEERISRQE